MSDEANDNSQFTIHNSPLKNGYKQTDVGIIPEDWSVKNLGNVAPLQRGFDLSNRELRKGIYPVVYSNGIMNTHAEFMAKAPGVVTGRSGTIGKVNFIEQDYFPHNTSLWVTDFKGNNPKYIYYLYLSVKLEQFGTGSGVPTLNRNDVHLHQIPVPPLPEQQAIAEVLSDVDALITRLDQLITKKRNIKQGAMQLLLTGKKRLPNFSGDWETKTLGEIVAFRNGKAHENHISENGSFVVINSKFVSTEGEVRKFSDICFLPTTIGEIVMVMSDVPNGKAIAKCFYIDEENKYTVNQRICSLKPLNANSTFLFYLIDRNDYYLTFDDGVKQTNLRKDDVLECPLKIPPTVEEQKAIAQILSDMDAEIAALESRRDKYQAVKQGMMQELLTGKTRLI